MENNNSAKKEYLEKLDSIRRGNFVKVKSFAKKYGINEENKIVMLLDFDHHDRIY